MTLKLLLVSVMLLLARSARGESVDTVFHVLAPVYAGLAAWDAKTAIDCVEWYAQCSERNVTGLKQLSTSYGVRKAMAVKLSLHTGIIIGVALVRAKWPTQKRAINGALLILNSFQFTVNVHNERVMRGLDDAR